MSVFQKVGRRCVLVLFLPANWDGKVEDGEHLGPLLLDVQVSDDGGSDGGVAGLPDADQAARQQQSPEILEGRRGEEGLL